MGSKQKRSGVSPSSGQPPRQEVDRLIAKKWYKDAVRQAKICYRDHPTAEHHKLLEQAYLLRAQELRDGGMAAAAQEVAGHLLDFGITDTALNEPVAALLVAVGMAGKALEIQSRVAAPEALERLNRQAADQAVLHPERASSTPREILDEAKRVRSALEALTAGDEPKALELLRDVSRSSPLADWRLFAKGLAAFRRGEDAEARASWDRLDNTRSASRIARTLLEVTGSALLEGRASPKVDGLERWALGEPILGPLRKLAEAVVQGEWPQAVQKLGSLRLAIRRVDPALAVRLTQALYSPVYREAIELDFRGGNNLIRSFTKAAEPLPFDPRWNRLWALAWEGPQGHPEEADPYWRKYIDDLESSPLLKPEERPRARALVLTHMGEQWMDLANDLDPADLPGMGPVPGRPVDREAMEARRQAVAYLEESVALYPTHRQTHQALIEVYHDGGQPDRAAEAARRMLKALPDDLDALKLVYKYEYDRNEPAKALETILQARKLKPLDPMLLGQEWASRVALARQLAIGGKGDEGRAQLDTAERLVPERGTSPHFAARKASLELKDGHPEVAQAVLDDAQTRLVEPAPLWLAMAIEARRFELPRAEIDRYEAHWVAAVSGKVKGETAGALADLLGSFLNENVTYPGRDGHVKQVVAYLSKTTRIKYSREDLIQACRFLVRAKGEDDLLKKLANRGLKLFPDVPDFPLAMAVLEVAKGPLKADLRQAKKHLESALKLAQAVEQRDPSVASLIPQIRQLLTVVNDLTGVGPMGMPFPFPGGGKGSSPEDLFEAFQAMMDEHGMDPGMFDPDDEFDDDFFDDGEDFREGPAPAPRASRKKKKKKKR